MRKKTNPQYPQRQQKRRSLVSTDFLLDVYPLTDNQQKLFNYYDEDKNIVAHGAAGTGKAQPLYSKVLTPSGWVAMGDLKIGDQIVTPKSKISNVTAIYPQGKKDIYELTFHDGSKARCCEEHLWQCYYPSRKKSEKKLVTTKQIINFLQIKSQKNTKRKSNISIDLITPIETLDINLPLNPYLLGVIIGDGSTSQDQVMICNADTFLIDSVSKIISEEFQNCELKKRVISSYDYFIILKKDLDNKNKINPVNKIIRNLGLFGKKSYEKVIPEIYLKSSIKQKIELIRGLFDTDGTAGSNKKHGAVTFTTTSEILAKQVQELIWSIGGLATITQRIPTFTYNKIKKQGKLAYTVHVKTRNNKDLFTIPRKKDRCKSTYDPLQFRRRIKDVSFIGEEEAQCIMIEDSDHLYITDNYVITHNTMVILYKALKEVLDPSTPYDKVIILKNMVQSYELGFLSGSLESKIAPFESPYKHIVKKMFDLPTDEEYEMLYGKLKSEKIIDFSCVSFLRGATFDNCILIVDEFQNLNGHLLSTVITRIGTDCKIFFIGDGVQTDLRNENDKKGLSDFMKIIDKMPSFKTVEFSIEDCVRSGVVKEFLLAQHELGIML